MAIVWNEPTQSHTIYRRGVEIDMIIPANIDPADPRSDRAIEAALKSRIQGKAAAASRGCVVLVHIFSRNPLDYVLRIAPPGYTTPAAEWWNFPPESGAELGVIR